MREYLFQKQDKPLITDEAVTLDRCHRCDGDAKSIAADFYGRLVCTDCGARSDTTLYYYDRILADTEHVLDLGISLTERQRQASLFMLESLLERRDCFVHAVCGAGKTEMTLAAILQALQSGLHVCFAIPRKQIVIQLEKRFKNYFPKTTVKGIYEEKKDDNGAHLVIATIQQLINFRNEFDLLIIDEVDAFPYADSMFFSRLTAKALKSTGVKFLISATITKTAKQDLVEKGFLFHQNPERYHGNIHDLPVFHFVPDSTYKRVCQHLHPLCLRWAAKGLRGLIFVPSVANAATLARMLKDNGLKADSFSSKEPHKEAKLARFSSGMTRILVATTILERGITYANVQVCVLFADHPQFTTATLIQMAGRVGRDARFAKGEIWFFSEHVSKAMKEAKEAIKLMNKRMQTNGN